LFEGGFEVFDDFLGENVGVGQIVGVFEAFISEPQDVEARLVAAAEFLVIVGTPPTRDDIKKVET